MFISDKFIFNGIHSDEMSVALVTFDSEIFNKYGLEFNQEISLSKGGRDMSHFIEGNVDIKEIELNIALIDDEDSPLVWDDDTLIDVTNWLITDSFVEFISEDNIDLIYYFKTTKIVKNFTHDKKGYLQVTFQPFSNSAYKKFIKKYTFNNPGSFTVNNISYLREMYKPIIEIKNLGDKSNVISIENETLKNEPFVIQDLDNNELVKIDGLLGTVYNENNDNLLMKCNRKWLQLTRGKNKINVSGDVEICIKCQFPTMM